MLPGQNFGKDNYVPANLTGALAAFASGTATSNDFGCGLYEVLYRDLIPSILDNLLGAVLGAANSYLGSLLDPLQENFGCQGYSR